jgi:hypothetical protein
MKHYFYISIFCALAFTSCQESAHISVQNRVHNATLESVNYGEYSITYSIYPGETSSKNTILDNKNDWPKTSQLEFFMVRDGNRVYLKTIASYELNIDDDLLLIIADSTEVVSPFGKKAVTLTDFK